jgi:hypothetical protein
LYKHGPVSHHSYVDRRFEELRKARKKNPKLVSYRQAADVLTEAEGSCPTVGRDDEEGYKGATD